MRKKRNTKSRAIRAADGAVICLCLLGAAAFLGLFYADLNRSLRRLNEEPVGFIAFSSRAALRRFQDRIIWDRLRKESAVYNGDFIRTAERSEAAVSFPGGELIGISENSLIRIFVEAGVPRIEFGRGDISVYAGEAESFISFGGNRIRVAAGAVVSLGDGNETGEGFKFQVIEGNAALITPAGERDAAAGTALVVDAEDALPGTSRVSVFTPPPAARYLTPVNAAVPVEFNWNSRNASGNGRTRIRIARDRDFDHPLTVWEGDAPEIAGDVSETAEIPPGTWRWRVSSGDGREEILAAGGLTVVHFPPPEPLSPETEAAYYYQTEPPELRFQWRASDEALYYILEAADNPGMANPALRTEVRSRSLVSSRLAEGRWYWRVTPVFSALYRGPVPASPVVPFTISRGEPPGPVQNAGTAGAPLETAGEPPAEAGPPSGTVLAAAAETLSPRPAVVAERPPSPAENRPPPAPPPAPPPRPAPLPAASERSPENGYVIDPGTLRDSRTIVFNWNPVQGANAYRFTLFQETASGLRRPVISFEGPETSYTLEDLSLLDLGRFVWQVEALSQGADGTVQRQGIPGENRFTVDIPQPNAPRARDTGILYGR
jgi:hypothetical protein